MKKYFFAAAITLLYVPIVTIAGELYAPLKNFLKNTFWHHWLGKSVLVPIIFLAALFLFAKAGEGDEHFFKRAFAWVTFAAIFSVLSIFLFFVFEYLKAA